MGISRKDMNIYVKFLYLSDDFKGLSSQIRMCIEHHDLNNLIITIKTSPLATKYIKVEPRVLF